MRTQRYRWRGFFVFCLFLNTYPNSRHKISCSSIVLWSTEAAVSADIKLVSVSTLQPFSFKEWTNMFTAISCSNLWLLWKKKKLHYINISWNNNSKTRSPCFRFTWIRCRSFKSKLHFLLPQTISAMRRGIKIASMRVCVCIPAAVALLPESSK